MSTTAQWVFDKAIYLMDEQNESSGATVTTDTNEYKLRTVPILNVLRGELYPYSDNYPDSTDGTRPVCPELTALTDLIGLDDVIAQTILPYGLAAHLMLGENDQIASFFLQRYQELKMTLASQRPATWEDIEQYYGGLDV